MTSPQAHPSAFNFGRDVVDHWARVDDKPALIWRSHEGVEQRFRFSDIARLSAQLASSLDRLGICKGDRVIVMLPRIPEWQIAMVACLKLGAVAVPCIEMLTAKDVAYRVDCASVKAVITTRAQVSKFASLSDAIAVKVAVEAAHVDAGWHNMEQMIAQGDAAYEPVEVAAEDPALLYFTSGSTGHPKGVLHASRALWHWRHSAVEWLDLTRDDLIWCTADTGWSKAGTSILFGPWSCGSCVFFYDGPFDAGERLRLLQQYQVTVYCAAGTEILRLLDMPIQDYDLDRLRRTVSAGEALSEVAIAGWQQATGQIIAEAYGQTESLMSIGHRAGQDRKPQSMGQQLAHNEMAVIDEQGHRLPDGEAGELAMRAPNPQLMLGYWNDPERTAQCYIMGPDGTCWFRTGDRAERDADGFLFHRGRIDDVINSAGYRIGPAEVEDVLLSHPAVAEAGVVGVPDTSRGEMVCAFVVLRDGMQATVGELQDYAKSQTAPYKYPRVIHFIEQMPKTLTGKTQRNKLREEAVRLAGA